MSQYNTQELFQDMERQTFKETENVDREKIWEQNMSESVEVNYFDYFRMLLKPNEI